MADMQQITWTEAEFKANVAHKMAALRAVRAPKNSSFNDRMACAQELLSVEQANADALVRNSAAPDLSHLLKNPNTSNIPKDITMFARVIDTEPSSPKPGPSRRSYTAADDSFGASSNAARSNKAHPTAATEPKQPKPVVPKLETSSPAKVASPQDKSQEQPQDQPHEQPQTLSDAESEYQKNLRLLEVNERQSSDDWVVLDRATVLSKLAEHAGGLQLARLAELLMGDKFTVADTRRLSAMMKREEQRGTVTRAGRGQPIQISAQGTDELNKTDVASQALKSQAERQRRVDAQQRRLRRSLS